MQAYVVAFRIQNQRVTAKSSWHRSYRNQHLTTRRTHPASRRIQLALAVQIHHHPRRTRIPLWREYQRANAVASKLLPAPLVVPHTITARARALTRRRIPVRFRSVTR